MNDHSDVSSELPPILALCASRDIEIFDLLIEDMDDLIATQWGELGFDETIAYLNQTERDALEFVVIAMDSQDESDLAPIANIVTTAKSHGVKTILVTQDILPGSLHRLLSLGADEFIPYPLPEGELAAAISRMHAVSHMPNPETLTLQEELLPPVAETADQIVKQLKGDGDGVLIAVQGMAGGCGATTFAVNLAHELSVSHKTDAPRVCLIDLSLQYGAVATYLDLDQKDTVLEALSDVSQLDGETFALALAKSNDRLQVLTAPNELVPLDLLSPMDTEILLNIARQHFDFVIVDMPSSIVQWTETVLNMSQIYFALTEQDMRSAHNIRRLKRALQSEDLPFEKLRFILNKAPKFTDLQGRARTKTMAEGLGLSFEIQLPDGGRQVSQSCDHGTALANHAAKNPLRKEFKKLATQLLAVGADDAQAA